MLKCQWLWLIVFKIFCIANLYTDIASGRAEKALQAQQHVCEMEWGPPTVHYSDLWGENVYLFSFQQKKKKSDLKSFEILDNFMVNFEWIPMGENVTKNVILLPKGPKVTKIAGFSLKTRGLCAEYK